MKVFTKRSLTSVVYVVVMILLIIMKWAIRSVTVNGVDQYFGSLGFDAVFCAIAVIGSMEFINAANGADLKKGENPHISLIQKVFTVAFCAVIVPLYAIVEIFMPDEGFLAGAIAFAIYAMFIAATSVFDHGRSTVKGAITCVFVMLYCGVLTTLFSAINHLPKNSMIALLTLLIVTMFTDAGAYLIGKTFKRFIPLKLAPKLSPNKTVIGAVGGLIGGILGGLLSFVVIMCFGGMNGELAWIVNAYDDVYFSFMNSGNPVLSIILISLITSVLVQIGDLFESAVKRECNIKDMGRLLPGHGGVLDRFDGMLCCSIVILFSFGTIIL